MAQEMYEDFAKRQIAEIGRFSKGSYGSFRDSIAEWERQRDLLQRFQTQLLKEICDAIGQPSNSDTPARRSR